MIQRHTALLLVLLAAPGCTGSGDPVSPAVAPCDAVDGALRGPWAVPLGQTLFVRWEGDAEGPAVGCLTVTAPGGGERTLPAPSQLRSGEGTEHLGSATDDGGTFRLYEARLPALVPGRYSYRARTRGAARIAGSVRIVGPDDTAEILILGDTNTSLPTTDPASGREIGGMATARLLKQAWQEGTPDVLIHAGDIAYHLGFPLNNWSTFWGTFAPYLAEAVFVPAIGNHEYEFSGEFAHLMAPWFGVSGQVPVAWSDHVSTATRLSTPWVLAWDVGPMRVITINSNLIAQPDLEPVSDAAIDGMFDDLAYWLDGAEGRWKTVVFHHPIYTRSEHTAELAIRRRLVDLDDRYDINLVVTGHNHVYERFAPPRFDNVVSGGGGAFLYNLNDQPEDPDAPRVVGVAAFHTVRLKVSDDSLRLTATDVTGTVLDDVVLERR